MTAPCCMSAAHGQKCDCAKMETPNKTSGPFRVGETRIGKPAVYGTGKKRVTPFGTEYEAPLCTVDTEADAIMICDALNAYIEENEK